MKRLNAYDACQRAWPSDHAPPTTSTPISNHTQKTHRSLSPSFETKTPWMLHPGRASLARVCKAHLIFSESDPGDLPAYFRLRFVFSGPYFFLASFSHFARFDFLWSFLHNLKALASFAAFT